MELLKDDRISETECMEHHKRSSELPAPELANDRTPHRAGRAAGEKGWSARAHPARGGVGLRASLSLVASDDAAATPLDLPSPMPAGIGRRPVSCAELLATIDTAPFLSAVARRDLKSAL